MSAFLAPDCRNLWLTKTMNDERRCWLIQNHETLDKTPANPEPQTQNCTENHKSMVVHYGGMGVCVWGGGVCEPAIHPSHDTKWVLTSTPCNVQTKVTLMQKGGD